MDIFEAASQNKANVLEDLLAAGADPNQTDFDQKNTPLHYASARGNIDAMEILIDYDADVNARNRLGKTPLHTLILQRYDQVALWLIQYCNADPYLEDNRNLSPYDLSHNFFQTEIKNAIEKRGLDGIYSFDEKLSVM
eukprot:TRINITY_DN3058_c0_g1_i2.p1 TRINITY_DN3058_c0_g1~~TRINITY_DN3058_c0_g1_i2.p1  ORF type:complete len:138 (-),score=22.91 TRINITY_DN3058_c0_g1_i2:40-453(-)